MGHSAIGSDRVWLGLTWSPGFGCFRYFDELAGVDVIDVTVNGNILCDEGMLTNTAYVLNDA